ncbi:MAG: hypothetical protein WBH09_09805 [Rugosibacter sp.]
MRSARKPQLDLRLAAVKPDAALRWHEGASVLWLGQSLQLAFCSTQTQTCREADILHLLLPKNASPRQIQDCAEAWLRSEAMRYLTQCLHDRMEEKKSALVTRRHSEIVEETVGQMTVSTPLQMAEQHEGALTFPRLALSFAARGHWVVLEKNVSKEKFTAPTLRCYWRLIEQAPEIIDAALTEALAPYVHPQPNHSLFAQHA